jgi:hypothetical protein
VEPSLFLEIISLLLIKILMSKKELIEKTVETLNKLPEERVIEISDFADFILKKDEDAQLLQGIAHLTSQSKCYDFLEEEENLYTLEDIKETYNGKG